MEYIKLLTNVDEIKSLLFDFKNILPSLRESRVNILDFSKKLHTLGYVCAWKNDNIIKGFAAFYANDISNRIAFLSMIAVKEEYRREHIGSQILNFVESVSQSNGMCFLRLEVAKSNMGAVTFYNNHGYRICEKSYESYYMIKQIDGEG